MRKIIARSRCSSFDSVCSNISNASVADEYEIIDDDNISSEELSSKIESDIEDNIHIFKEVESLLENMIFKIEDQIDQEIREELANLDWKDEQKCVIS
jgi:hypothetical protein